MPPAKVFVIGGGVAGLAAAGQVKNGRSHRTSLHTRAVVKEQAGSMEVEFLEINIKVENPT